MGIGPALAGQGGPKMSKHHVSIQIAGDGWTENAGLLAAIVSTADEAAAAVTNAGYELADNIDRYDAEDGPGVAGYEPDGHGVFIVAVMPNDA